MNFKAENEKINISLNINPVAFAAIVISITLLVAVL